MRARSLRFRIRPISDGNNLANRRPADCLAAIQCRVRAGQQAWLDSYARELRVPYDRGPISRTVPQCSERDKDLSPGAEYRDHLPLPARKRSVGIVAGAFWLVLRLLRFHQLR